VSPDTALRLARFFGTTPHFWLNLQASYDLKIVMRDAGTRIERDIAPLTP
jgi:addiction module HigA family antidote